MIWVELALATVSILAWPAVIVAIAVMLRPKRPRADRS